MGLPIKLTCTTNINDVIHRTISSGEYFPKQFSVTIAPAMDLQVLKQQFIQMKQLVVCNGLNLEFQLTDKYEKNRSIGDILEVETL